MKFYLLPIILFVVSCSSHQYYYTKQINELPLLDADDEVDLYYKGEILPDKPFVEAVSLAVSKKGNISSTRIQQELKKQARLTQVDDVIEVHEHLDSYMGISGASFLVALVGAVVDPEGGYEVVETEKNTTYISGIGIKYLDNLNHLENILKSIDVFYITEGTDEDELHVGSVDYTKVGKIANEHINIDTLYRRYKLFVQPYSDFELFERKDQFYFVRDSYGRIKKRCYQKKDRKYIFRYNSENQVKKVIVNSHYPSIYFIIDYTYNSDGTKALKTYKISQGKSVDIKYHYHEKKLVANTITIRESGTAYNYYVLHTYFKPSEYNTMIDELLRKEQTEESLSIHSNL